jgi:hypothetical protein
VARQKNIRSAALRVAQRHLLRQKTGFDQYNAVALMSQLQKLLPEETWAELKSKGFPRIVNDAWMGMTKKERRSLR